MDILGWQWCLHAMVLHIGATKNEGHFVVYVLFDDKWWLFDDGKGKAERPHPNPRKATFLLCKRKATNLFVPNMLQYAPHRTRASALRDKGDAYSMPTDTCVPAMALPLGAPPPPPPCATQGPSGAGDRNNNMHAQSMASDLCVAALAMLPHVSTNSKTSCDLV